MRRLAVLFSVLVTAAALGACGDAGDHFGEFRQNPPGPTVVNRLAIKMPIVPGKKSGAGTFQMFLTAYSGGNAIPQGTVLNNPIEVYTNYPGYVTFNSQKTSRLSFGAAPGVITVNYQPPPNPCKPVVGIVAFNKDAQPQSQTFDLVACSSPKPSAK